MRCWSRCSTGEQVAGAFCLGGRSWCCTAICWLLVTCVLGMRLCAPVAGDGAAGGCVQHGSRASRGPALLSSICISPDPLASPTLAPPRSYDDPEIALQCGQMFRDCIRHEAVARLVLDSHIFPAMFGKLELSNFEVASGERRGQGRRHCKLEGWRLASPSAIRLCRRAYIVGGQGFAGDALLNGCPKPAYPLWSRRVQHVQGPAHAAQAPGSPLFGGQLH